MQHRGISQVLRPQRSRVPNQKPGVFGIFTQDEMAFRIYTKKLQNAIIKFESFCQHIRRKHSTMTRNRINFLIPNGCCRYGYFLSAASSYI